MSFTTKKYYTAPAVDYTVGVGIFERGNPKAICVKTTKRTAEKIAKDLENEITEARTDSGFAEWEIPGFMAA